MSSCLCQDYNSLRSGRYLGGGGGRGGEKLGGECEGERKRARKNGRGEKEIDISLKMLDARPGFIVKFLKRSLIVNLLEHELSTASLQSSTGKVILNHINYSTDVTTRTVVYNYNYNYNDMQ